jgi:hypothetical protein
MANTNLSLSVVNGAGTDNWTKLNAVTVGTSAPGAGDFEFRVNATDTNGNTISRLEMLKALKAFKAVIESDALYTTDLAQ